MFLNTALVTNMDNDKSQDYASDVTHYTSHY